MDGHNAYSNIALSIIAHATCDKNEEKLRNMRKIMYSWQMKTNRVTKVADKKGKLIYFHEI